MVRARLVSLALAASLGMTAGCSNLSLHPLFGCGSSSCSSGCPDGVCGGMEGLAVEGPILEGPVGPGCPGGMCANPPVVPPNVMPPLAAPPRLVPQPQSQPVPYTPPYTPTMREIR